MVSIRFAELILGFIIISFLALDQFSSPAHALILTSRLQNHVGRRFMHRKFLLKKEIYKDQGSNSGLIGKEKLMRSSVNSSTQESGSSSKRFSEMVLDKQQHYYPHDHERGDRDGDEIYRLMHSDYGRPRRKPPINNQKPND